MDDNTHTALERLRKSLNATTVEDATAYALQAIGYAAVSIAHTLDLEASRER